MFDRLDQQATYVNRRIEETASKLYDNLDSRANALGTTIDNALRVFDAIDQQSSHISGRLGEVVVQLQSTGSTINDLLVTTSGTISSHLKETSDIVARQMQNSGIALAQNIENSSGSVTDKMIAVSGEFIQKIGGSRDGMFTSCSRRPARSLQKWMRRPPSCLAASMTRPCRSPARSPPLANITRKLDPFIGSTSWSAGGNPPKPG